MGVALVGVVLRLDPETRRWLPVAVKQDTQPFAVVDKRRIR